MPKISQLFNFNISKLIKTQCLIRILSKITTKMKLVAHKIINSDNKLTHRSVCVVAKLIWKVSRTFIGLLQIKITGFWMIFRCFSHKVLFFSRNFSKNCSLTRKFINLAKMQKKAFPAGSSIFLEFWWWHFLCFLFMMKSS